MLNEHLEEFLSVDSPDGDTFAEMHEEPLANRVWLQFFVAHRPQRRPEFRFVKIKIDGVDLDRISPEAIPGQQGQFIDLGYFATDRIINLEWEIHVDYASEVPAMIGVFHGSMQKRSVLAQVVMEPFSKFSGESELPSKGPAVFDVDSGVYIENTYVHNQCEALVQSVMLRNNSVSRYRVHVLKQGDHDEHIPKALKPGESHWLGCTNDGFSYSIERLEKLP